MIRAVVAKPGTPGNLAIESVAAPQPGPHMAVVRVETISLNQGEVKLAARAEPGKRIGWDLAGTVARAAADGTGPREGERVVGILPGGAWAEEVAVPSHALAVLPKEVSAAEASTLPVAGLTALYALEKGSGLLARNVLVTGASGGVGLFACQLAALSGARVVALIRQERHEALMREFGVRHIVASEDGSAAAKLGPYRLVLESVGGAVLGNAVDMLGPDGVCVVFGSSSSQDTSVNARQFYSSGRSARIHGLNVFGELAREHASIGLERLLRLMAERHLRAHISVEAPWEEIARVGQDLMARRIPGKAVLHIRR